MLHFDLGNSVANIFWINSVISVKSIIVQIVCIDMQINNKFKWESTEFVTLYVLSAISGGKFRKIRKILSI